jgi:hypothetical protein
VASLNAGPTNLQRQGIGDLITFGKKKNLKGGKWSAKICQYGKFRASAIKECKSLHAVTVLFGWSLMLLELLLGWAIY